LRKESGSLDKHPEATARQGREVIMLMLRIFPIPTRLPVMLSGLKSRASLEVFPDQLGAAEPHLY